MLARLILLISGVLLGGGQAIAQSSAPPIAIRNATLQSVVRVDAFQCPEQLDRTGSGFVLAESGKVITAHHVVGGCNIIQINSGAEIRSATVSRVLAKGDLALLSPTSPLPAPGLRLANPPPDQNGNFSAAGFQNNQLSAGDVLVSFSAGSSQLNQILTAASLTDLRGAHSAIDFRQSVLRFNAALQPGMSGGPIVDRNGHVIGIVAGGLKAGAAPASWGWPAEWIAELLVSGEVINRPVRTAMIYYSSQDLRDIATSRSAKERISCGLGMVYHGRKSFAEISAGADDYQRLQHIVAISGQTLAEIAAIDFDLWVHEPSGATAVVPAGLAIVNEDNYCVVKSNVGPFQQVIWSTQAPTPIDIQNMSITFEQNIMYRKAPYGFGFQIDPQLTTFQFPNVPGPLFRDNMVFNRKGFSQPKQPYFGPNTPMAHSFETLVAKSGTFLGVGTINDNVPANLGLCLQSMGNMPGCGAAIAHLHEWSRFVLATQLSTYPAY